MKLRTIKRPAEKKNEVKKHRREGKIPAIIYSRGGASEAVSVDEADFQAILRNVRKGHLSTTKISLVDGSGKERTVIIKDIQYHVTTYRVIHLDFEELIGDVKVKVNIPIEFTGVADCVGIKLGGVLRQVIRNLRVLCLPKDMPAFLELDVQSLAMNGTKRLKDLSIPSTIRPLGNLDEVCVVIAKK